MSATPPQTQKFPGSEGTTLEERRPSTHVPLAQLERPCPCTTFRTAARRHTKAGWCGEARQAATEGLVTVPPSNRQEVWWTVPGRGSRKKNSASKFCSGAILDYPTFGPTVRRQVTTTNA